jgi:hypothetical protein
MKSKGDVERFVEEVGVCLRVKLKNRTINHQITSQQMDILTF